MKLTFRVKLIAFTKKKKIKLKIVQCFLINKWIIKRKKTPNFKKRI